MQKNLKIILLQNHRERPGISTNIMQRIMGFVLSPIRNAMRPGFQL